MDVAEQREPYDARVSRTVLRERGGGIPPRHSPVPLENTTGQHRLVCHVHHRKSAEYDAVLQLADARGDDAIPGIRAIARRKAAELRSVFPVRACGFPENWRELLAKAPDRLADCLVDCPHDDRLSIVKDMFPKSMVLLSTSGGDPHNALSIVDTLDPAAPDEDESIRTRRQVLHNILSRDLALWREELCTAEVWLARYEETFGRIK